LSQKLFDLEKRLLHGLDSGFHGHQGSGLSVKWKCGQEHVALLAPDDVEDRRLGVCGVNLVMIVSKLLV
jgi:hypothetical protein